MFVDPFCLPHLLIELLTSSNGDVFQNVLVPYLGLVPTSSGRQAPTLQGYMTVAICHKEESLTGLVPAGL